VFAKKGGAMGIPRETRGSARGTSKGAKERGGVRGGGGGKSRKKAGKRLTSLGLEWHK